MIPPLYLLTSKQKEEDSDATSTVTTIMQTAHILPLTILDGIQVGQSAASYLQWVTDTGRPLIPSRIKSTEQP